MRIALRIGLALPLLVVTGACDGPDDAVESEPEAVAAGAAADGTARSAVNGNTADAGERLLAAPPQGWVPSFQSINAELRLVEFVPEGTEPWDWDRKIAVESFAADPLPDPIDLVTDVASQRMPACEGLMHYNIFSGFENNYPTSVRLLHCDRSTATGDGLLTMAKAIQGNEHAYVITRSLRLRADSDDDSAAADAEPAAASEESPMDAIPPSLTDTVAAWSLYMRSISVCDDTRSEHPCPSDAAADSAGEPEDNG